RERLHRLLVLLPAGEEEAAEQRLRIRAPEPGRAHRRLEHRAALVKLGLVLREVPGLDVVAEPDTPGFRPAEAEQRLEQGRLAGAVRADERDVLAALDRERRFAQQRPPGNGELDLLCLDDDAAGPLRLQEVEAECAPRVARHLDAVAFDALDLLQLRLRLPRFRGLVAEALDEPLEAGGLLRLPLPPACGVLRARPPL